MFENQLLVSIDEEKFEICEEVLQKLFEQNLVSDETYNVKLFADTIHAFALEFRLPSSLF